MDSKGTPTSAYRLVIIVVLVVSFFGFLDAVYLTAQHYSDTPLICSTVGGCNQVITSKYATIGHIPVALIGSIFYLTIFILGNIYASTRKKRVKTFLSYLTIAGFLTSLWFVYLQLFVIRAICFYCIVSAATSSILFIAGMHMIGTQKNHS